MGRRGCPLVIGAGAALLLALSAGPAGAELSGPCAASGTFEEGRLTVDPKTSDGPVEIPVEDAIEYRAAVFGTGDVPPRRISGEIKVDLPFPLPDYTPGTWSDRDAVKTATSGRYTYDVPEIAFRGIDIEVTGFHDDSELGDCKGSVTVRLEGGFFDSVSGPLSLGITVIMAAGVVRAAIARPAGAV
jgi:hypothetical protein